MCVKYFCDDCGKELILPFYAITNMNVDIATMMQDHVNCTGIKYYDSGSGYYLDLCNECRDKRLNELSEKNYKKYLEEMKNV